MLRKITHGLIRRGESAPAGDDDDGLDFSDGPLRPLDDASARDDAYHEDVFEANRSLEALALESIIAPTLTGMRDRSITKESALARFPRQEGKSLADEVREALDRRPSSQLAQALGEQGMALLSAVLPKTPMYEHQDPLVVSQELEAVIMPMPKRPSLKRRPTSYKGRQEMPLRVQTLRRNHQAAFVASIMRQIEEEAQALEASVILDEPLGQPPSTWNQSPELEHWGAYRIGDGELSPPVRDEGPSGESPVIYYDAKGRPFI